MDWWAEDLHGGQSAVVPRRKLHEEVRGTIYGQLGSEGSSTLALRGMRRLALQHAGNVRLRVSRTRFRTRVRQSMFNRLRTRTAYQKFLESSAWARIRAKKLQQNPACEFRVGNGFCGSKYNLQCHHVVYPVRWEQTQVHHLQTLCRRHHAAVHGKAA